MMCCALREGELLKSYQSLFDAMVEKLGRLTSHPKADDTIFGSCPPDFPYSLPQLLSQVRELAPPPGEEASITECQVSHKMKVIFNLVTRPL